ncbi:MAG TPA: DUF4238 domain-containing protein [Candidatus Acidoferrum sp.]|nr:DUF4238 domain-containing protein [Candidatus Acidoferrum sp.]
MATVPTGPEAKAQHYIPKFYLKGFTDERRALWVYEKFKPFRESKPKHQAHRPDYYTHTGKGERDETAEDMLKSTESRVAPIICKLANPLYVLTPEKAAHLIIFVAFMFARVPSWREYLDSLAGKAMKEKQLRVAKDKEKFYKLCRDFETKKGETLGMDHEQLRQFILNGEFELAQKSAAFNLGAMFSSALAILEELQHYRYQALYAPNGKFFVTSDSPVNTVQPEGKGQATIGMGFGWQGVEVYFPLNKRACLKMKKGIEPGGGFIAEGHVDQINNVTMATATRYLYSNERLRRIARLFDERGCKVRPGKESFLSMAPSNSGVR